MAVIASLVATTVSAVFSHRLAARWRRGRTRPSMLAWSIALAMFSIASAALLVGAATSFNEPLFRLFYLFGAVLNVPWLALGSVLVNSRDRITTRLTGGATLLVGLAFLPGVGRGEALAIPGAVLGLSWAVVQLDGERTRVRVGSSLLVVAWSLLATTLVLPAPLTGDLPASGLPEASEVLPGFVRGFAVGGNTVGCVVVIVGALAAVGRLLWQHADRGDRAEATAMSRRRPVDAAAAGILSGWRALGPAGLRHLAVGNLLIAAGVTLAAGSGAMFSFPGDTVAHAVGISLGVVVMYLGFDRTGRPTGPPTPPSREMVA